YIEQGIRASFHLNNVFRSISSFDLQSAKTYNTDEASRGAYFKLPDDCVTDNEAESWTGLGRTVEPQLRCISRGHGKAKVLLIGNSYAYRTFPVLHKIFNGRYAEFRLFTKSSRMFLNKDPKDNEFDFSEMIKEVIKKSNPDLVFVIEKDMNADQNKGMTRDDPILKFTQEKVDFLSENVGTVVIDEQFYKPNMGNKGVAKVMEERLNSGKSTLTDFEDLRISRSKYNDEHKFGIQRLDALSGWNVVKNKVEEHLCDNEFCYLYVFMKYIIFVFNSFNPANLYAYYGDTANHQTVEMIKFVPAPSSSSYVNFSKLEPGYRKIIEDFLERSTATSTTMVTMPIENLTSIPSMSSNRTTISSITTISTTSAASTSTYCLLPLIMIFFVMK
ncbi:hypothetical protein PRIPAC_72541, partial [Pristionchus pacificus]|uniref:SGNH domain-containing protein n=1 Tax=Pristionchus pacificus TaxID=54126 RepID=A0A2A6CF84_PRIPA